MAPQNLWLTVVRPDDLLVLRLEFRSVELTAPSGGSPGEIAGSDAASLIVHLQGQHIAEQVFWQTSDDHQDPPTADDEPPLPPGQVQAILSGPSRLAFDIPTGEIIPLTLAGVLEALERLPLRVSAVSRWQPPGCLGIFQTPPAIAPPEDTDTAIEAPYRLFLSPDPQATWAHSPIPIEHADWTELWHTRLGSSRPDGDPRVRAIWSPDFQPDSLQDHSDLPFRMTLDGRNRNEIVHKTSNLRIPGFSPTPVETEQFMLSSLGAWMEVDGSWDVVGLNGDTMGLVNWRHETKMARDQYVRVVESGFLLPYCHLALYVEISERKFLYRTEADAGVAGNVAYLYKRGFIIVRQLKKTYSRRDMPLRSVTFKTRVTPNLVDPTSPSAQIPGTPDKEAFWARINSGGGAADFQFHLLGTDWEGNQLEWTAPLIWISANLDGKPDQAALNTVIQAYNAEVGDRRRRPFSGQSVAFAPEDKPGDTTLETVDLSWEGAIRSSSEAPHFRPLISEANVAIPAVQQLAGNSQASTVTWEDLYLNGSGSSIGNQGEVFLRLTGAPSLGLATEKVGGMVAPDLGISGLSRALGPVGGTVDNMVDGNFDPLDIFDEGVKLLGGISLRDIIENLIFDAATKTVDEIPGLVTERLSDRLRTTYTWTLNKKEQFKSHPLFLLGNSPTFTLTARVDAPFDGSAPTFEIAGSMTDFSVVLLPSESEGDGLTLIQIGFNSISFVALPGQSPSVTVDLGTIDFNGILEFVNGLRDFIPLDGFNAGPAIELVSSPVPGLNVGFTLGIPTIGVGILTIQNISLTAGFYLPFGDAPLNFHFAFCERQQPFILTVSLFGGGGFFSIDIGVDGVKMLEASFEFGAAAAINLGVASGEASMMAGIYFQMAGKDFELTAYFRAYGSLSVLGIITISLEFYLSLSYASKGISPHGGHLWGQASLTVKIEILFFSISVSVSCEREFAGSDPQFRDMLNPGDWEQYADAFAAYPA